MDNTVTPKMEGDVQSSLEHKLDEILKNQRTLQAAAVKREVRELLGGRDQAQNPQIYVGHVIAEVTGHVAVLF